MHAIGELGEEVGEHVVGAARNELGTTESVHLVSGEPEAAILGDHLAVEGGVSDVAPRVVLLAVDLENDTMPAGEEDEEVHPLSGQGAPALARGAACMLGHWVEVQVDLWNESGDVELLALVAL